MTSGGSQPIITAKGGLSPLHLPPQELVGRETGLEFGIKLPSASQMQAWPLSYLRPHWKKGLIHLLQVLPLPRATELASAWKELREAGGPGHAPDPMH